MTKRLPCTELAVRLPVRGPAGGFVRGRLSVRGPAGGFVRGRLSVRGPSGPLPPQAARNTCRPSGRLLSTRRAAGLLAVLLAGCAAPEETPDGAAAASADQAPAAVTARNQPGTGMGLYEPEQHELYDGRFVIAGTAVHQVGRLDDESPWDHMGDDASNVAPVGGEILIDVDEIANAGTFRAELDLPEGKYVVELDRFHEFSPCQDGGIAAYLFEHGDAGCGDSNWPKSLLYVAGWGYGRATLDGEELYRDYQIHFMVTQGMRDRETLKVQLEPTDGPAGAVNPAAQQLDFYIRSPETNDANHPNREVFDHFFAMEVTWK